MLGYAMAVQRLGILVRVGLPLVQALCVALLLLPGLGCAADQRMVRIGVAQIVSHAALDADERGFEAALASAGFKEGVNIHYDRQNAHGDVARITDIARKFEKDRVDLVHSIATPTTQAMFKLVDRIPLVFSAISDPVDAGLVPADSAPGKKTGSNVTGVSDMWPVLLQMETYAKFVPQAKKWGTIYNPTEANSVVHIKAMRKAAKSLGLELVEVTVGSSTEVEQAANSLVGKVQAITITSDNTTVASFDAIAKVCNTNRIALFSGDVDSVPQGAIAAYGMDYFLVGYAAGKKAALVLKGVKPGDIPWGPVEKFSLIINLKAARAQGVAVSADWLKKADKVLE